MGNQQNAVVLYSRSLNQSNMETYDLLLQELRKHGCTAYTTPQLYEQLSDAGLGAYDVHPMQGALVSGEARAVLSIGGDGTYLEAAKMTMGTETPILGINHGRLGFLSDVAPAKISEAIESLMSGNYRLQNLDVLSLYANDERDSVDYALNEFSVSKCDNSSMLTIKAYVDGEYLTTYWADGLIVSTAAGSTAYSMSVGGPIVFPATPSFIITPIAPHNLTVRPLIVPNTVSIRLHIEGRGPNILTALDGRTHVMENGCTLRIAKTPFDVRSVQLQGHSFFAALREKLMWGADTRNTH